MPLSSSAHVGMTHRTTTSLCPLETVCNLLTRRPWSLSSHYHAVLPIPRVVCAQRSSPQSSLRSAFSGSRPATHCVQGCRHVLHPCGKNVAICSRAAAPCAWHCETTRQLMRQRRELPTPRPRRLVVVAWAQPLESVQLRLAGCCELSECPRPSRRLYRRPCRTRQPAAEDLRSVARPLALCAVHSNMISSALRCLDWPAWRRASSARRRRRSGVTIFRQTGGVDVSAAWLPCSGSGGGRRDCAAAAEDTSRSRRSSRGCRLVLRTNRDEVSKRKLSSRCWAASDTPGPSCGAPSEPASDPAPCPPPPAPAPPPAMRLPVTPAVSRMRTLPHSASSIVAEDPSSREAHIQATPTWPLTSLVLLLTAPAPNQPSLVLPSVAPLMLVLA